MLNTLTRVEEGMMANADRLTVFIDAENATASAIDGLLKEVNTELQPSKEHMEIGPLAVLPPYSFSIGARRPFSKG